MKIEYSRVSTAGQQLDTQILKLKEVGCEIIFKEKATGRKIERPELQRMIDTLRTGDEVIINDLTRISRSTKDLFSIVDKIEKKGANIKSLKEGWLDTTTSYGKLIFTIFSGFVNGKINPSKKGKKIPQ